MAITITRTSTNITGSPASPSSVAAGATSTSSLSMTSPSGVLSAVLSGEVQVGASIPTTNITVRFSYTLDATNYTPDGGDISIAPVASTNYDYSYTPPPSAQGCRVTVINGASNAITLFVQGNTLAVS